MTAKRVSIGVLGAGYIANVAHLPVLRRLPEASLVAVCDEDMTRAKASAERFGIPKVYSSLEEMLSHERLEIVDICLPPHQHKDALIMVIEHGVNCLVEKPLTMTMVDTDTVINLAQERGVSLHIIYNYSVLPGILKAKELAGKGLIGQVTGADIKCLVPLEPRHLDPDHWCHRLPGDYFSEISPHLTMLLVELLGEFQEAKVIVTKSSTYSQILMDEMRVVARCGTALGTITCSLNCPSRLLRVDVFGTDGTLSVDGGYQAVTRYKPIRSSGDVFARGLAGVSEIVARSAALTQTTANVLMGRYRAEIHGHRLLLRQSLRSLLGQGDYPINLVTAREAERLLETVLSQVQSVGQV